MLVARNTDSRHMLCKSKQSIAEWKKQQLSVQAASVAGVSCTAAVGKLLANKTGHAIKCSSLVPAAWTIPAPALPVPK